MTTLDKLNAESAKQRELATQQLCALLRLPEGYSSKLAADFVDTMAGIALLNVAAAHISADMQDSKSENP
jgi:hypothetical protein